MEFAKALKRFRESQGLSQAALANVLGIKTALYQRYEWGKTTPSVEFVIKMAKAYKVTADYLLGLSDSPRPPQFDEQEVKEAFALRDALKTVMNK
ncbi:MAG: helix-turn-helix transcriptional regulator [Selenomonadaceae bacterium]|nr:helix-turn-helix transcriptional regulator [Selenomonadaceae bacterium]